MFDIGWGELLVIGVVALVAIGPKELPGVLRTTGQWMGKVRRMAAEFQDQFKEAMREAELDDLKKKVDDMAGTSEHFTNFDPIGTVRNEIQKVVGDPLNDPLNLDGKPSEPAAQASTAEASPPVTGPAEAPPAPQPADTRKAGEGA